MKALVLGSTGFVGKNLTKMLESQGHEVIKVSRKQCQS